MNLRRAFRLNAPVRAALVGAGGKTTALFQLARLLEPPVLVTASTHLGAWQAALADQHSIVTRPEDVAGAAGQIEGVTLFTGPEGENERLAGVYEATLAAIAELADRLGFSVLVEADGSRRKPLKAPADHEPAVPGWANLVIVCAGLGGLGKPLDADTVHRPERFAELSGLVEGDAITPGALASVLLHPQGGLKGIPSSARKIALLNQADTPEIQMQAVEIASRLIAGFDAVVTASLETQQIHRVIEPCAGILLAGGGSSRYGEPKMLLPWRGKPLIRHAAEAALSGGLSPVVVVTGAVEGPLRQALAELPVEFAPNPDWQEGQSTSLQAGLRALPERTGSAVFLLADQPFVTPDLIRALRERHAETLAPVVAPRVGEKRANPVLFDRDTFPDLLALRGDTGGRAIFQRTPVSYLDWPDTNLLLDVDTPEDYARLEEAE